MCGTARRGADALPRSKATLRAKGSHRNLGDLVSGRRRRVLCVYGGPHWEGEEPKPMMHGHEKSDLVIVAMKPANKAKEAHCGGVGGVERSGVGGAKGGGQGEYAPAQHVLDPEPGSRDKRAGAYTATFAVGGNITGLSMMATELYPKRLQLLKDVNPQLTRVAVLWNSDHPFHVKAVESLKKIAPSLSIELSSVAVRNPEQFGPAITSAIQEKVQALYVVEDPIFFAHQTTLLELASAARLPTIHELRRWPEASALMSYGPDLHDLFRRSAFYVDRILKGAKPGDLPVEQPTKFELVINLKTAKTLGLEIPPTLLALADEVIE